MKNLGKAIVIFAFCVILVLALLGGCKNNKAVGNLPDDPYSFNFMLDGDLYSLPTTFSAFASNGWVIDESAIITLSQNDTNITDITNGKHKVTIYFINNSEDSKILTECDVIGISLNIFDAKKYKAKLVFPGNLKVGDPFPRAKELYGEPSSFEEGEIGLLYYYNYREDHSSIYIVEIDNTVQGLFMYNDNKAIGNLPDDPNTFTFMLNGDLYSLPTAFSAFASNGWVIDENGLVIDESAGLINPSITNGKHEVYISLVNSKDKTTISDSHVVAVSLDIYNANKNKTELVFPGNLMLGDPFTKVKEIYGEPLNVYEQDDGENIEIFYCYNYKDTTTTIVMTETDGRVYYLCAAYDDFEKLLD